MAKTIANFLVGIGLDTKDFDKGSRGVDTALSGFRSKAQLAGGAIAAAFGAVGLTAIKAGSEADAFMRKVEKFSTAPRFIYSLGNAFERMGGQANDAITTIEKTEGILDALRKGDPSALEDAGLAQVDVSQLQASQTGEELLANLADVLSRTGNDSQGEFQRRSLAQTFGLSDEGLKLLAQGRGAMYGAISQVDRIAENLEAAAEAGREYSKAMADVNLEFKRIGNTLAAEVLPHFTELLRDFSGFLSESMPAVKKAAEVAADNKGSVAAVTGGTAIWASLTTAAAVASKLGLSATAGALRMGGKGGLYGAAAGAASGVYGYLSEGQDGTSPKDLRDQLETNPNAISDYIRSGTVNGFDAAESSPSAIAARKPSLSEMARSDASVPPPIVIENKLMLNEREIAKTIRKVNAEDNYNAYTEVVTTESR